MYNLDQNITTGKGYWKCNIDILRNEEFKESLTELYNELNCIYPKTLEWWEDFKHRVKLLIIDLSKIESYYKHQKIRDLENDLRKLTNLDVKHHGKYTEEIKCKKKLLNELILKSNEGIKIRTKTYSNEEEKPSRFFMKKEIRQGQKKYMKNIKVGDEMLTCTKDIENHCREYYKNLYTSQPTDENLQNYFLENSPKLSECDRDILEGYITYDECITAINSMENNKTPGSDGLPKEFYSLYFYLFGNTYVEIINNAFENGLLSISQRTAYITLICKNEEHKEELKYWRPISLLNYDYKILSKILTKRLNQVIHTIVHLDQTSAVPNRSIIDNCHLYRNIIDYIKYKPTEICFISLDYEKAFDRIDLDFLFKCLEKYGFGTQFIKWIKLLYTDIYSSVITNNHVTNPFKIQRGVRQGCSLSPLVYVLVIEHFARKIRNDNQISGLKLPGSSDTVKISLYADDNTLILTDTQIIYKSFNIKELFEYASGSKINKEKTHGIWLSKWKNKTENICNIQWSNNPKKIVGFYVCEQNIENVNWSPIVRKIQNCFNMWNTRKLSFDQKSEIINLFAMSKTIYLLSFLCIPKEIIKKLEKLIFEYFWNKQHESVNRRTVILPKTKGGFNLFSIIAKSQALQVLHIRNLILKPYCKWHTFAIYWIGLQLKNIKPEYARNTIPHAAEIPLFYENAIKNFMIIKNDFETIDWKKITCKYIYNTFVNKIVKKPIVIEKFQMIDFYNSFNNIQDPFIDTFLRDLNWKIVHNVLPVNSYMYNYGIIRNKFCYFCKKEETLFHLFYECTTVKPVITLLENILSLIIGKPHKISLHHILYHDQEKLSKHLHHLRNLLYSELKFVIWILRNKAKHEHRHITTDNITHYLINRISIRCKTDYNKLQIQEFKKYWTVNSIICKIENNELNMVLKY